MPFVFVRFSIRLVMVDLFSLPSNISNYATLLVLERPGRKVIRWSGFSRTVSHLRSVIYEQVGYGFSFAPFVLGLPGGQGTSERGLLGDGEGKRVA